MTGPLADHVLAHRERRLAYREALRTHRRQAYAYHDTHFGIRADGRVYWLEQAPEDPTFPDDRFIGHDFSQADRWVIRTQAFADVPGFFVELCELQEQWALDDDPEMDPRPEWEATYRHQQLGV